VTPRTQFSDLLIQKITGGELNNQKADKGDQDDHDDRIENAPYQKS
jgi:hypothetical protein